MTIRSLRASMIEVLQADYILTAKAKGVATRAVLVRHALRNALIPMITVISVNIGWLVGGTVVDRAGVQPPAGHRWPHAAGDLQP